jgi:serine/threonine-protein kinase HipA
MQHGGVALRYAPQWLTHGFALSEDLPLRDHEFLPTAPDAAVGAVDDARPDRWGERVIRFLIKPQRLSTLDYLYFAGDDRFGGLSVSLSELAYQPYHHGVMPQLKDVQQVHDLIRQVERGESVPSELLRFVAPGATLGGAKPKALLNMDGSSWVLKFSESGEAWDSGMVEHACMTLAQAAGIEVCETRAMAYQQLGRTRHAVAVRRFDRVADGRCHALSAHVALRAAGVGYRYAEMALWLRRFAEASRIQASGEQVFRRLVFNILMDNTDDHEKNHAFLRVNSAYALAPAFDVVPSGQGLGYQSMEVGRLGAESSLTNALSEHAAFGLTAQRAQQLVSEVTRVVSGWQTHFVQVGVSAKDIQTLAQYIDRPFLKTQRDDALPRGT